MDDETKHELASGYGVYEVIEDVFRDWDPEDRTILEAAVDLPKMVERILFAPFPGAEEAAKK